MEDFIKLLQAASPMSVIALLAIIIFQLVKGENLIQLFRLKNKVNTNTQRGSASLDSIAVQLEKIAGNHLHDLPGIREDVTKILNRQEDMNKELNSQGQRMVRVETLLGIGVPEKH